MLGLHSKTVVAADVGGTNTRVSLHQADNGHELIVRLFDTKTIGSIETALSTVLEEAHEKGLPSPSAAAVGAAGPVVDGQCQGVNVPYLIDQQAVSEHLGGVPCRLVNDFVALARVAPVLPADDLISLGGETLRAPTILIGPGTGFGTSVLIPDDRTRSGWSCIPGEAGHMNVAPADSRHAALIAFVRVDEVPVCCDDLLSGKGLSQIYSFLRQDKSMSVSATEISRRAREGDALCLQVFDLFFDLLASVASDLCLAVYSEGGLIIGGGIVPLNFDLMKVGAFRARFAGKKDYGLLLQKMPIRVIQHPRPGLLGAAALAADLLLAPRPE